MDQSQDHNQMRSPPIDATPQDVLAEARKNLQVLIDSGLSKDLLHQWVDDSLSLQLSFPNQPSFTPVPSNGIAIQQHQLPLLEHQQPQQDQHPQQQHLHQQQAPSPSHLPPPPPVPQCPPPPPPRTAATREHISIEPPSATVPSTAPITIKSEASLLEGISRAWSSAQNAAGLASVSDADAGTFMSSNLMPSHRPRISVSSTSSGSSGHASIWSTNSARSSLSWHSASTGPRSQAPLPMLPPNTPTSGTPLVNGAQIPATASTAGRQNVYWCTSCETSFKRKYDWKRHEDEFHERWRKYPCPEPGCNRSFWGSNSFNQHHKQCHGCKTCPHAEKIVKFLRKRKYWACGFCSALHPARERHVEHVARHFESGMTKGDWMHSRVVYGLLHQPLIHEAWDGLVTGKQPEYGNRRPQFSWHPSKTGRAQGFLENENKGQLQDLLEFFSGDDGEAQWIVSVAYDLADIVLTSAPTASDPYSQGPMVPSQPAPSAPQPFSPGNDQISLHPMTSQPQLLSSPSPSNPSSFSSPFRNTMFASTPSFSAGPNPSPESTSHSPLTASHSPLDKRELPPPPTGGDSLMDFEYSPAPVVFEEWGSLAGAIVDETASQHSNATTTHSDWGIAQYFGDPRVTS